MELQLYRLRYLPTRTVGQLYVDREYFCFTQEDTMREIEGKQVSEWKIKGSTAIPVGRYQVVLQNSPRFGPDCPTLLQVPGYDLIRVHAGNTELDTEGCLLLGFALNDDGTIAGGTSAPAVREFKQLIKKEKEPVWITIINSQNMGNVLF